MHLCFQFITTTLFCFSLSSHLTAQSSDNYLIYHVQVEKAEIYLSQGDFETALGYYENVFEVFDFIFVREYKVACQLALYLGETDKAKRWLEAGIRAGWTIRSIKQNNFLEPLKSDADYWDSIINKYEEWRGDYKSSLNTNTRTEVKEMLQKDQKLAFRAFLRIRSKAQDRFAEKHFAPHSEKQMEQAAPILDTLGYPGEKLIGNNYWMSTILSHHNSISERYNQADTLYGNIRPALFDALGRGEISPFELALIDEWYQLTSGREEVAYGILNPPTKDKLQDCNKRRSQVRLRSVELRNALVEIQEQTGINFYLPGGPWINGAIEIL